MSLESELLELLEPQATIVSARESISVQITVRGVHFQLKGCATQK